MKAESYSKRLELVTAVIDAARKLVDIGYGDVEFAKATMVADK